MQHLEKAAVVLHGSPAGLQLPFNAFPRPGVLSECGFDVVAVFVAGRHRVPRAQHRMVCSGVVSCRYVYARRLTASLGEKCAMPRGSGRVRDRLTMLSME